MACSDELHIGAGDAGRGEERLQRGKFATAGRQEQSIDLLARFDRIGDLLHRARHGRGTASREAGTHRGTATARGNSLGEGRLGNAAIGCLWHKHREVPLPARQGEGNNARHIAAREEAQEIDAIARDFLITRKGDHGDAGAARHLGGAPDFLGEERADDQFGTILNGALGGKPGTIGRASGILRHQRNTLIVEIEQGKFGGLFERLGYVPR